MTLREALMLAAICTLFAIPMAIAALIFGPLMLINSLLPEAKGTGFDTKIMREIIRLRRMDLDSLDEYETLLDLYKQAIGMRPANACEAAE